MGCTSSTAIKKAQVQAILVACGKDWEELKYVTTTEPMALQGLVDWRGRPVTGKRHGGVRASVFIHGK
jgi:hypothetical protein